MTISRRETLLGGLVASGVVATTGTALAAGQPARRAGAMWSKGAEGERRADLGDGTYRNPVLPGDHPDPSILKDGDAYYQVSSSFIYYPGLVIWKSTDLVNWEPVGPALREPVGSVYAPDLTKHDGRFYIYFPARGMPEMSMPDGSRHKPMTNYVVHSEHIEGPWSDPIDLGIDTAIDPGHAVGEDGKRYLYVSSGTLIPLTEDGLHRAGPDEKRYQGWTYPADWAVETFALEGPKILRKDGWFYLFSAQGGTAGPPTSHMVVAARSRSIRGPWENCPSNPIVHTRSAEEPWWSRGHGTPVEGPSGDWWMLYHGYENGFRTLGRQGLLEPMRWTADGWPQATGGDLTRPLGKPINKALASHDAAQTSLSTAPLGSRLSFFKPGRDYENRLRFDGDTLRLDAQGKGPADSSPLVLNTGDQHYELTMELELDEGTTAGLLLFYNEKFFCGISSDNRVFHAYNLGAENPFEQRSQAPAKRVYVRLVNQNQVGRFSYSTDGQAWTLHRSFEVAGYNHNIAGGYLSLRPAIFAAGQGAVAIRNLRYKAG